MLISNRSFGIVKLENYPDLTGKITASDTCILVRIQIIRSKKRLPESTGRFIEFGKLGWIPNLVFYLPCL
jgi:hypothetical protein